MLAKAKLLISKTGLLYLSISAVLIQRFFHFSNYISEPMAWRQYDTEFYAYDFYLNGINFLKPAVCWMGAYRTTILEFPLISALISVLYSMFSPSVIYARAAIFIFFIASAYYLYLLVKHLYYPRFAGLCVLVYISLPISIYYSAAVNIDYPVIFFSLAALYHYIKGYEKESYLHLVLAALLAAAGFVVKSPYLFFIYIPLAYYVFKTKKLKLFLKSIPLLALPALAFILWQKYALSVNAQSPDWFFIPDYFKFTDMSSWYFGSLSDRFVYANWERLFMRFGAGGITYIGFPLFLTGLAALAKIKPKNYFFYFYFAGCFIYLLIFFTLNVIHDYYQVPFAVITSVFIAAGVEFLYSKIEQRSKLYADLVTGFLLLALMVNGIWFAERWYYRLDIVRNSAAAYIRENTPPDALVIASIDLTDPRDPRILAPARRYGWAVPISGLTVDLIKKLKENNATHLAITLSSQQNLSNELGEYLGTHPFRIFIVPNTEWRVIIVDLYGKR